MMPWGSNLGWTRGLFCLWILTRSSRMWTSVFVFRSLVLCQCVHMYNMEIGVMNLVQCLKCHKFGYKQTCCSLDITYLKCGVKDHSDAICQRPVCDMNYTALISLDCTYFCRRVQFTECKLKRASHSWRLKGSIPTPVKIQECYMC